MFIYKLTRIRLQVETIKIMRWKGLCSGYKQTQAGLVNSAVHILLNLKNKYKYIIIQNISK